MTNTRQALGALSVLFSALFWTGATQAQAQTQVQLPDEFEYDVAVAGDVEYAVELEIGNNTYNFGATMLINANMNVNGVVAAPPVPAGPTPLASYDATIVDSVTLDGSNNVEQWDDQSGNDRHATQATPSERPGYTSGVSIDPQSGDSLDIDSLDIGSEHDIFVVYKYESGFPLFFGPRVDGFTYTRIDNGGGVYYRAGSSILSWFTGAFSAGDWHILRFQRSAGAVTLYRNGVSQGQKTGTLNDFSFTEVVGVSASGVCNAGSVRVYDALSDEDAATVTSELAAQFSITLP